MIQIKIVFTKHALEKRIDYGWDENEIKQVIIKGMKWKENDTEKWHANMAGIECVFIKEEDTLIIITVYPGGK